MINTHSGPVSSQCMWRITRYVTDAEIRLQNASNILSRLHNTDGQIHLEFRRSPMIRSIEQHTRQLTVVTAFSDPVKLNILNSVWERLRDTRLINSRNDRYHRWISYEDWPHVYGWEDKYVRACKKHQVQISLLLPYLQKWADNSHSGYSFYDLFFSLEQFIFLEPNCAVQHLMTDAYHHQIRCANFGLKIAKEEFHSIQE
jgi:hypothetical protein